MPFASVNGQQLYFEDTAGTGPVVVFSHGNLMNSQMWAPQVEAMRGEFRCVVWDARLLMGVDDISGRLGQITQPALVVHGEADQSIPLALGQLLRDRLPGASDLIEIPGAGHTPSLTHPDQVNGPLAAFLRRRA